MFSIVSFIKNLGSILFLETYLDIILKQKYNITLMFKDNNFTNSENNNDIFINVDI